MNNDEHFMKIALEYAREALSNQEVPVGCIFVYENEIIARGRNEVNETKNATRHAEFICIDAVLAFCKEKNLTASEVFTNITVYVTVEPCIMCAAALYGLDIKNVVYGCANDRFGGKTVLDVSKHTTTKCVVTGGLFAEEAMDLLKKFYGGVNPNAPQPKVKGKKA